MDLSILQEDTEGAFNMTMVMGGVVHQKIKSKSNLPVVFPVDYYSDPNNVRSESEDPNLIKFQRETIKVFYSANGNYFVGLLQNGDFDIYCVKNKSLNIIKGMPLFSCSSSRGIASIDLFE